VTFSPSGNTIAIAHEDSPRLSAYPWSGSGFGTKYANPSPIPGAFAYGVAFNPQETAIAVAHDPDGSSSTVSVYEWSTASGFGTKYANPAVAPAGQGLCVSFSTSGSQIAVGSTSSPYITAYPWSAGFGTKYSNPAINPDSRANGISFSPKGNAVAVATNDTPFITAYPWNPGFGTKYANPATLPAAVSNDVAFSPEY
jgi:WD40 repeat protein